MKILEISHLEYSADEQVIVEDINLTVEQGKIVSIIGPNGSGKSTIAKIICNILNPSSGKIIKKKNLQIGYVPQQFFADKFMPMTVQYFFEINDLTKKNYSPLAEKFKLSKKMESKISKLSGGELQRMLLVSALASYPDLLVLDEPTQYLDIDGQIELYRIIEEYTKQHKTAVLVISHDLHMVMKSSDHVICLNRHICCEGNAAELHTNSDFNKLFGNQLSSLVAPYQHHHDHKHELGTEND
jgi:zinc transport system ATP-binding protein